MNKLSFKKILFIFFVLFIATGSAKAQLFHKNPEKQLFGKSHRKEPKVKEPKTVLKAKKKQEANDRKLQKEYDKNVKRSQKRSVDIQTSDVQDRMKQNKKEYTSRDKNHKKKVRASTKRAGKKYD
ncbi:MAG TPA: hypothetical protein VFE71_10910 [Bacteroidales bacterium]|nr:hypothetical protein [Bacteroidales bacterium]